MNYCKSHSFVGTEQDALHCTDCNGLINHDTTEDLCSHNWAIIEREKIAVKEKDRKSCYDPVSQYQLSFFCQKCLKFKTIMQTKNSNE